MGIGSGDRREDDAADTGSALGDLWRAVAEGLLSALRDAILEAFNKTVGPAMARLRLRRRVDALFAEARARSQQILNQQITQAVSNADAELRADFPGRPPRPTPPAVLQQIGTGITRQLANVQIQAQRSVDDAFARAVGSVMTPRPGISEPQRLKNAQKVLDDLAGHGITVFTDRAGRTWELTSYVEMATRTAVSRSLLNLQLTAYTGMGQDAVLVISRTLEAPCPRCRPYDGRVLSISGHAVGQDITVTPYDLPQRTEHVVASLSEAIAHGLLHPNCFPGEVLASAPSGVRAADSRWYEGDLVVIHTASGDELPVTPNHPILTSEGWVPAGLLKVGQSVLRYHGGVERMDRVGPGDQQIPARIGEIFDSLRKASPVPPVRVPSSTEQFHGDGRDAHVEVVLSDSLLRDWGLAHGGEMGRDGELIGSGAGTAKLASSGPRDQSLLRDDTTPHGVVSSGGESRSLCARHAADAAAHGIPATDLLAALLKPSTHGGLADAEGGGDLRLGLSGPVTLDDLIDLSFREPALPDGAVLPYMTEDGGLADAEGGRYLVGALAGSVELDQVVDLGRRQMSGHVYNLQSGDGWYVANGIVVHNCRHALVPYADGQVMTPPGLEPPPPAVYEAEQRQRALERRVREHRRRVAVALPGQQARAKRRLAAATKASRVHAAAHGIRRRTRRERIDVPR